MEDQQYLAGLKNGDRVLIQEIYSAFLPAVKSWIKNNHGTDHDAFDVFQEALEIILLKIDKVHTSFGGLIMQLCKRRWIDKLRKEKNNLKVQNDMVNRHNSDLDTEPDLVKKEEAYIKYKLLEKTFEELSTLCQRLMTLLKEGRSIDDIINELDFSNANSVYRRKAACMSRWSQLLKSNKSYALINE